MSTTTHPTAASPFSLELLERRSLLSGHGAGETPGEEPHAKLFVAGGGGADGPDLIAALRAGPAAPTPRFEGYNVVMDTKMYALGGFDEKFHAVVPDIDMYDSVTNRWTTIESPIMAAGTHAGVASDGSSIYFAGGYVGDLGEGRTQKVTRAVWRYDTATNTWDTVAPLPAGRGAGALVRVGRELHYFGGCLADRVTNTGAHWMLQLGRSSGGKDDGEVWTRRPAMPSPRDHFAAVEAGGLIYTIGGEYGHDIHHDQSRLVHSFDTVTGKWKRLADLPIAKSHTESGTFALDGKIYVGGGQVDNYEPTANVVEYDIESDTWRRLRELPEPRQGGAFQKVGDKLVVGLGGIKTDQPQDNLWYSEFNVV